MTCCDQPPAHEKNTPPPGKLPGAGGREEVSRERAVHSARWPFPGAAVNH